MNLNVLRCTLTKAEEILSANVWSDLREALSSGTLVIRNQYQIDCRYDKVSYVYFNNGTRMIIDH